MKTILSIILTLIVFPIIFLVVLWMWAGGKNETVWKCP
jgi:hypothetical protein